MNLEKIKCYVPSGGAPVCRPLGLWLDAMELDWEYGPTEYDIDIARNRIVEHFLNHDLAEGKRYLLMVDRDAVPIVDTGKILTLPGDMLYCGQVGREGHNGHYGDTDFGCQCCRISAALLTRLTIPWFRVPRPENLLAYGGCECTHFREAAAREGYQPKMVSIVGHEQTCIIFPVPESETGWKLSWPSELPYERTGKDIA